MKIQPMHVSKVLFLLMGIGIFTLLLLALPHQSDAQDDSSTLTVTGQSTGNNDTINLDFTITNLTPGTTISDTALTVETIPTTPLSLTEGQIEQDEQISLIIVMDLTSSMPLDVVKQQLAGYVQSLPASLPISVVTFGGENSGSNRLDFTSNKTEVNNFIQAQQTVNIGRNANAILEGIEAGLAQAVVYAATNNNGIHDVLLITDTVDTSFADEAPLLSIARIVPDDVNVDFNVITLPSLGSAIGGGNELPDATIAQFFNGQFGGSLNTYPPNQELSAAGANSFLASSLGNIGLSAGPQTYSATATFSLGALSDAGLQGTLSGLFTVTLSDNSTRQASINFDYTPQLYTVTFANYASNAPITGSVTLDLNIDPPLPTERSYRYEFLANDNLLDCSPTIEPTCAWDTGPVTPGLVTLSALIYSGEDVFVGSRPLQVNVYRENLTVSVPQNLVGELTLRVDAAGYSNADSVELFAVLVDGTTTLLDLSRVSTAPVENEIFMTFNVDERRSEFETYTTSAPSFNLLVRLVDRSNDTLISLWRNEQPITVNYTPEYTFSLQGLPAVEPEAPSPLLNATRTYTLTISSGEVEPGQVNSQLALLIYENRGDTPTLINVSTGTSLEYQFNAANNGYSLGNHELAVGLLDAQNVLEQVERFPINVYSELAGYTFANRNVDTNTIRGNTTITVPLAGLPTAGVVRVAVDDEALPPVTVDRGQSGQVEVPWNIDELYFGDDSVNTGARAVQVDIDVYAADGFELLARAHNIPVNVLPTLEYELDIVTSGTQFISFEPLTESIDFVLSVAPPPDNPNDIQYVLQLASPLFENPIPVENGNTNTLPLTLDPADFIPGAYTLEVAALFDEQVLVEQFNIRLLNIDSLEPFGDFADDELRGEELLEFESYPAAQPRSLVVTFTSDDGTFTYNNSWEIDPDSQVVSIPVDLQEEIFSDLDADRISGQLSLQLNDVSNQPLYTWQGQRTFIFNDALPWWQALIGSVLIGLSFLVPQLTVTRRGWRRLRETGAKWRERDGKAGNRRRKTTALMREGYYLVVYHDINPFEVSHHGIDSTSRYVQLHQTTTAPMYIGRFQRKLYYRTRIPDIEFDDGSISKLEGKIYVRYGLYYFKATKLEASNATLDGKPIQRITGKRSYKKRIGIQLEKESLLGFGEDSRWFIKITKVGDRVDT